MAEKKSVFERIRDLRLTIYTQTEVASLLTMLIGGKLGASVDELAALSDMLTESLRSMDDQASKIMDYVEELGV